MRSLKTIRESFGLSQEQLAIYLGVSRSSINMAERGNRGLPTAALEKLALLQKSQQNNIIYRQKALQQRAAKDNMAIKQYLKKCQNEIQLLQKELALMQEHYGQCINVMLALEHLLEAAPASGKPTKEQLWLEILAAETQKKMAGCSHGKQVILQLQIKALAHQVQEANKIKF
jgi:transcriptional regulator with XRE-family HTH domain